MKVSDTQKYSTSMCFNSKQSKQIKNINDNRPEQK